MVVFTAQHLFPYSFRDVAIGIWQKYPNEFSTHITSVDVLDRSFLPNGTLRTERLISISQHAPRWIMKLVGGAEEQYVREVIFYKPPSSTDQSPMVLMGSVNLLMSSFLICREQIRYQPFNPQTSSFFQRADIEAQGSFAIGESWGILGSRLETWARDRFSSNAESGRLGFNNVLATLHQNNLEGRDNRGESNTSPSPTKESKKKSIPTEPPPASMRLA
ncbi:hypothetical protein MJO28_000220 [Puccinia striiformis f. sp. tritici]|uniref:PRELI/MSF1 domain-containing protein n=4 Tax=Puccinia striiformis TaxID=27350 RepID=A0A0L0VMJ3_9BASI|nr:hypothetical protein MJO28_000220 [Puccinia striiformis f. sp. tritici]KAI7967729.1 hypothetical protein MJO29_001006 [Puccinia striiformis f. sp. tritici]KAI9600777.1 hypothetical protein H4Q26_000570 [Puccinia striiformis f. sp. tritici PST-130]KNF00255.1 hypothetical protein PSTG_06428 [Puccinia striiformis f. sp. tritici PST-78]